MYTVESAGEDEQVVARELGKASVEFTGEYEASGFVDYEEGKDDPRTIS
jgi:hypothetical protein